MVYEKQALLKANPIFMYSLCDEAHPLQFHCPLNKCRLCVIARENMGVLWTTNGTRWALPESFVFQVNAILGARQAIRR